MNFLNVNNWGNFNYNSILLGIGVATFLGELAVVGANSQPHENGVTLNGSQLDHAHTIYAIQVKTHHKKVPFFRGQVTYQIHYSFLF